MGVAHHNIAKAFLKQIDKDGLKASIKLLAAYIIEHGLHLQIEDILHAIELEYKRSTGVHQVNIRSARPLSGIQLSDLKSKLIEITGAKELVIDQSVDPSLIGGFSVNTDSVSLDNTVKSKLEKLRA